MLLKNYVAWKMADGQTMAGELLGVDPLSPSTLLVGRVDGGLPLPIETARTWPATYSDVQQAIAFYNAPGPLWQPVAERLAARRLA